MKRKVIMNFIFCFCIFFLNFGCKSLSSLDKDVMFSMIYDFDNSPVQNVEFYLDEKYIGKSDINGRFLIDCLKEGDDNVHTLVLKKSGYEQLEDEIRFENSLGLYYKIGSASQYLKLAERLLDENKFEYALEAINKSIELEENDAKHYLKAIILKKMNNVQKMEEELLKINNISPDNIYILDLRK